MISKQLLCIGDASATQVQTFIESWLSPIKNFMYPAEVLSGKFCNLIIISQVPALDACDKTVIGILGYLIFELGNNVSSPN